MLTDSDSETNDLHTLTINDHFAKAFRYKREREELTKLKVKYGSDYSESGSSDPDSEDSEVEEDSDGEELTPAVDAAILRTLVRIRKKDLAIYEDGRQVFDEEHMRTQDRAPITRSEIQKKSKSLTIRKAALASALADSNSRSRSPSPRLLTHTEEQALLRSETRAAFQSAIDTEAQGDCLLIPRSCARDEIELKEDEYKAYLQREVGEDFQDLVSAVGPSKSGGNKDMKKRDKKSRRGADQEFLVNYIFNRGWVDRSTRRVPTYNEIVESNPDNGERKARTDGATLSDEDSFDDLADAFETSYNFRFEEPDGALISTFPRNPSSVRREPTTRKDARTRKKERQQVEKREVLEARREVIRRERSLVEAAIAKEDRDAALAHLDLDADWDSSKHDAQMAELYDGNDIINDGEEEKPVWDDDIDIDNIDSPTVTKSKSELKKQRKKEEKKSKHANEDVGVDIDEMDADLDIGAGWDDGDEWSGTEEERKRKVDTYMDEVVNRLGFSGITSHIPTRFHYTSVAPENYGLAPAEILLATDAELNSFLGLKKLAPYRVDRSGSAKKNWDPMRAQRLKEFRKNLRSRVGTHSEGPWSLGSSSKNRSTDMQGEKKRKGKKERAKLKMIQSEMDEGDEDDDIDVQPKVEGTSQKRRRDLDDSSHSHASLPAEAEKDGEDGTPKKKCRRRHKRGLVAMDARVRQLSTSCHD